MAATAAQWKSNYSAEAMAAIAWHSSCWVALIQPKRTHKPTLALPSALRTWRVIALWRRRMVCHSDDVHITWSIMITWHLSRSDLSIQYGVLMDISWYFCCANCSNLKFCLSMTSSQLMDHQAPCLGMLNLVHVLNVLDIAFCLRPR